MPHIAMLRTHEDNYSYILHLNAGITAIDPGEAEPVLEYLDREKCGLDLILNTHMHNDHCHGNMVLKQATGCRVMGTDARIPGIDEVLIPGGNPPAPAQTLQIISTPGHTLNDCSYYLPPKDKHPGALFCGDTLFSGGCGRVFEGSVEQLFQSLQIIAALPPETLLYCGHEYTLDNYLFAEDIEPDSLVVRRKRQQVEKLRRSKEPTLPVSLRQEMATNPFLRPHDTALRHALSMEESSDLEVFAELRQRKNRF